ncbi:hypothetical protein LEN26_005831 [Aphanomyces euteiches]|nr:hypothetical protein LEN26_005831 [Aphanomyces euteiches]
MKIHPDLRWFYGGREVFGELVDENDPDAPPRRKRSAAVTSCEDESPPEPVLALTDEEKECLANVQREKSLAEVNFRLGVALCRRLNIEPVVTIGNILGKIVQERQEDATHSSVADEDALETRTRARRTQRSLISPRKKGKARKC